MMRMPRIMPLLAVTCSVAVPLEWSLVRAQDAMPTSNKAPEAMGMASDDSQKALVDLADTFRHYALIGRYDLAADAGEKLLSGSPDPKAVAHAFETVMANQHSSTETLDEEMLRFRTVPAQGAQKDSIEKLRDVATKINALINQGLGARSGDPTYIRNTIIEMSTSERAYDNNMPRIDKSGELAVKVLLDILRTPDDRKYNNTARRILRGLGRKALNPLLAATQMKDYDTILDVIGALGDIGYDASVPYLARLATSKEVPDAVQKAAQNALTHMGAGNASTMKIAQDFYTQAQKFYYGTSSIPPASGDTSYIWSWREDGLSKMDVPTVIFGDLMAMRECEYAMSIDPANSEAVSLWLAANTKREVDLPAGASDPSHTGDRDAHYYNASAGVKYLNLALARAIHDRNSAVTLKLTESLQDIIGPSNMSNSASEPVLQALFYPNRRVRYEAAFALAESRPTHAFPGSDRVVPVLVEAINQSSKPGVLVIAPDQTIGAWRDAIQQLGYPLVSASDSNQGANLAMQLPTVDIVIIADASDVARMIDLTQSNSHLQGASVLVVAKQQNNPFSVRAATDSMMNSMVVPPPDNLTAAFKGEIDRALMHAGTGALTEEQASKYALKAARLLADLAISGNSVMSMASAEGGVMSALSDSRKEIAVAAGQVLAVLDSKTAQVGLANKANDESMPAEVRVSLYRDLAANAKTFGNRLNADQIAALEKIVAEGKAADIRDAAADARGALNLPADIAHKLIMEQAH